MGFRGPNFYDGTLKLWDGGARSKVIGLTGVETGESNHVSRLPASRPAGPAWR